MTSGGSSPQGMPGVGKKADAVADRSGVPLLYNLACLHQGSPTRRENRSGFPGSKYSAPAPCRSGSKGEAPWSLRKERNPHSGNLHTAYFRPLPLAYCHTLRYNSIEGSLGGCSNDHREVGHERNFRRKAIRRTGFQFL